MPINSQLMLLAAMVEFVIVKWLTGLETVLVERDHKKIANI